MLEHEIIAFEPSHFTGDQRVLVLAPHPDDEVLGCGGALLHHAQAGDAVCVVFLTSGEQGDWQAVGAEETASRREQEAGRALRCLGVERQRFWRLPDRGVVADGALVRRIHETIRELGATLVYAPSPLDIHPDHQATAHALRLAMDGMADAPGVLLYETSHALPPSALIDVTQVLPRKWEALNCYTSQVQGAPPYRAAAEGIGAYRALTLGDEVRSAEAYRYITEGALGSDLVFRWELARQPASKAIGPETAEPAISVIVRTLDRPELLRRALASLVRQTRQDFEVVVVNDGGDSVAAILEEFPGLHLRLVEHETRRGRAAAANAGVREARADYLAFLDDDDHYYPPHLEQLARFLDGHPHVPGVYSDSEVIFREVREDGGSEIESRGVLWSMDFDPGRLLFENYIPNLCLMLRKSCWDRLEGYDESYDLYEDWEFLIRFSLEMRLHHLASITCAYDLRRDGSNATHQNRIWADTHEHPARVRIYSTYRDRRSPEIESRYLSILQEEAQQGRFAAARQWLAPPAKQMLAEAPGHAATKRLAIVLVHYRAGALCARAVESFLADARFAGLQDREFSVIVVDNGSDAEDAAILDALPVRVIRPDRNLGYAAGVNLGVAHTDAERIIVANPDLVACPGMIAGLLGWLDARGGIAGPRFFWDADEQMLLPPLQPSGVFVELLQLAGHLGRAPAAVARWHYRRHLMRYWTATAPVPSRFLSGALLAFTREAWSTVGPLDEGYSLYFEDTAWMATARRLGVPTWHVPAARAVHLFNRSAAREPQAQAWFHESRARFRRLHFGSFAARLLEFVETRLGKRIEAPVHARRDEAPSVDLGRHHDRAGELWAELSMAPLGIPATAARVRRQEGDRWTLPSDCWQHCPPGSYWLRLVDDEGREFERVSVRREGEAHAGGRRSAVSAGVEAPISVDRLRDLVPGSRTAPTWVVASPMGQVFEPSADLRPVASVDAIAPDRPPGTKVFLEIASEAGCAVLPRLREFTGEAETVLIAVPAHGSFDLVAPPEEAMVRRVVATLCEQGFEICSEREVRSSSVNGQENGRHRLLVARASGFHVRAHRPDDARAILDLFERVFHVERSQAHLDWKYLRNPFGPGRISLCFAADGRLAGHYAGYPVPYVRVAADGRELASYTALQVGDTMTDPAFRDVGSGVTRLLARTTRHFFGRHRSGEFGFYFGFNRGGIQRFSARAIGGHIVEGAPFWRAQVDGLRTGSVTSTGLEVEVLRAGADADRLDAFFQRVAGSYGFLAARRAAYLEWRYLRHPDHSYIALAVKGPEGMVGWGVFRQLGERLVWGDLLLDPEHACDAARSLVQAALGACDDDVRQVDGWFPSRPAFIGEMLSELGFTREAEPDDLSMLMLLEQVAPIELVREQLFYTMGDGDLF